MEDNSDKTVLGYIRVSTQIQVKNGLSLKDQEDNIRTWARRNEYGNVIIFSEGGKSGARYDNRPQLNKLMTCVDEKSVVVVYSISRLARSNEDLQDIARKIEKSGGYVLFLKSGMTTSNKSPIGKLQYNMMASFAEFERDLIAERVKNAMDGKKKRGEHVGRPPYGYTWSGVKGGGMKPVPEELNLIEFMKEMRQKLNSRGKNHSWKSIAEHMNKRGVKTRTNGKWYGPTVQRICTRGNVVVDGRKNQIKDSEDVLPDKQDNE